MIKNVLFSLLVVLCGCNYMHVKPGTMEPGETIYAKPGGYNMRRAVKQELEKRGFSVHVGKTKSFNDADFNDTDDDVEIETFNIPKDARYIINVKERRERFRPTWCFFNGYWWWNFNISISDQTTGQELFAWAGRGCMNSSIRKFNKAIKKLEK